MGFPAPPRLTAESAETAEPPIPSPLLFLFLPRENKKNMGGVVRPYSANVGKRLVKTPKVHTARNPFGIHGVVEDEYFTNRAQEVERIMKTLRDPGAKLLMYGPRRMGKTSALVRAASRIRAEGGHAIVADLSTASSVTDIGNRVLEAAARSLGRRWRDLVQDFVDRLHVMVTLTPDTAAGIIIPSLDVRLRRADLDDQRNTLGNVLDAMEGMASDRKTTIGIVLDEFQEIPKFGGDDAEWHLRGVIQPHHHVSYVLSGSATHVIERMTDTGRVPWFA